MVFYGPSGTGKTTIANIVAQRTHKTLYRLNATTASLQDIKDIIADVGTLLAPGGVLLYSTCTILPEENEQVTDAFLGMHPDFSRETFTLPDPIGAAEGQITLWPQRHGTDGFYICRMARRV